MGFMAARWLETGAYVMSTKLYKKKARRTRTRKQGVQGETSVDTTGIEYVQGTEG